MGATKTPRPTKLRRFSRAQSTCWPCRDPCLQGLQVSWQHPGSLPPDDQAVSCPQQAGPHSPRGFPGGAADGGAGCVCPSLGAGALPPPPGGRSSLGPAAEPMAFPLLSENKLTWPRVTQSPQARRQNSRPARGAPVSRGRGGQCGEWGAASELCAGEGARGGRPGAVAPRGQVPFRGSTGGFRGRKRRL